MSFRAFLIGLVVGGLLAYLFIGGRVPSGPREPMGTILTTEEKATCGITAEVTEGPYYVSGMPALTNGNLNTTNLAGSSLTISGVVYEGLGNEKPLMNTVLDIWQADNDGSYHPNGNGAKSRYKDAQLALRGTITTNDKGEYSFTTIYPGEYSGRTRHIHVKVRAPEKEELTTQLIVPSLEGDDITFDEDTVSQGLPIDHDTSPASATFDFRI
jgi:protocatechuate 3,4-dioxygenase beta subunit